MSSMEDFALEMLRSDVRIRFRPRWQRALRAHRIVRGYRKAGMSWMTAIRTAMFVVRYKAMHGN